MVKMRPIKPNDGSCTGPSWDAGQQWRTSLGGCYICKFQLHRTVQVWFELNLTEFSTLIVSLSTRWSNVVSFSGYRFHKPRWDILSSPEYDVSFVMLIHAFSSPYTKGSTYVYRTQLAPLFDQYEYDIDQFLASLQGRAGSGLVALVNWMWVHAKGYLNVSFLGRNSAVFSTLIHHFSIS
jgi:hypothetical protein